MAEVHAFHLIDPHNQPGRLEPRAVWPVPLDREVIVSRELMATWLDEKPERKQWLADAGEYAEWVTDWDREISRFHIRIKWQNGKLHVRRRTSPPYPEGTQNPTYYRNQPSDDFLLADNESFWAGRTLFVFHTAKGDPSFTRTLRADDLKRSMFSQPDRRLDALASLPQLIHSSLSDVELEAHVLKMLLDGCPSAVQAGLVVLDAAAGEVRVRSNESRALGNLSDFRPSRQLVTRAVRGMQNEYFRWGPASLNMRNTPAPSDTPTEMANLDWAICKSLSDDDGMNWAVYVAGRNRPGTDPEVEGSSDQKFVGLTAELFSSIRQQRTLLGRYTQLARMLPQAVLQEMVARPLEEILTPRECVVTVLYFDIRGSCKMAESDQENPWKVMDEMNAMMKIMTRAVNQAGGAIGDFQGDAAIACWGWPMPQDDQIELASKAALTILREFLQREEENRSRDEAMRKQPTRLPCGIGLAHGKLIAGRLGTPDQFKVALFGHAANLAARLQSMTKTFGAHVLVDEDIAKHLCGATAGPNWWQSPTPPRWCRLRPVAKVQPAGMGSRLVITELLPPALDVPPVLTERERAQYLAYLTKFVAGDWRATPPVEDGPAKYLKEFVEKHNFTPPDNWEGVIEMTK